MKNRKQLLLILVMLAYSFAVTSCTRRTEPPTKQQPEVSQKTASSVIGAVAPQDIDKKGTEVGTVEFVVRDPEFAQDGPSPYVSIEKPSESIRFMDKPDEIVVQDRELCIIVDYPVTGVWEFKIPSAHPTGFTRAELAKEISRIYHAVYAEEERTTKIKIIPIERREKVLNRNKTDGKYGIWGHDIGDLVLYRVELRRHANGKMYALLGIDS